MNETDLLALENGLRESGFDFADDEAPVTGERYHILCEACDLQVRGTWPPLPAAVERLLDHQVAHDVACQDCDRSERQLNLDREDGEAFRCVGKACCGCTLCDTCVNRHDYGACRARGTEKRS